MLVPYLYDLIPTWYYKLITHHIIFTKLFTTHLIIDFNIKTKVCPAMVDTVADYIAPELHVDATVV